MNIDLEQLTQQVKEVISYSQDIPIERLKGVSNIITRWYEAKKEFINGMHGQLIYENPEPVSFELTMDAKRHRLDEFISLVAENYFNRDLINFLETLSVNEFFNNKTEQSYYINNELVIDKHVKVLKAFKEFNLPIDKLKELQDKASVLIQENEVTGTLCYSVHPLDYLSASENVHNWRSCHALDGEYRVGNLNYMLDNSTVICYLRANKQAILPHFPETIPWNSKKWRVWFFFSSDRQMVFAGRQYPFASDYGINFIKDNLLPLVQMGRWTDFCADIIKQHKDSISKIEFYFKDLIPIGNGKIASLYDIIKDRKNTFHFNDLLHSNYYRAHYAFRVFDLPKFYWCPSDVENEDTLKLHNSELNHLSTNPSVILGAPCPCPICGIHIIDHSDEMMCDKCRNIDDQIETCDNCGFHFYTHELTPTLDGQRMLCPDCYQAEMEREGY